MSASDARPRLFNPGWGLWVFLAFALAFALIKFWPGGHRLASAVQVDACAAARTAAASLSPAPTAFSATGPGAPGTRQGQCELRFAPPAADAPQDAPPALSVFVMTQAMLSHQGSPTRTSKWIETTAAELRASNPGVEAVKGPWRTGFVSASPSGQQISLYAEDDGVVLMLVALQVERAALMEYGAALARALRKAG